MWWIRWAGDPGVENRPHGGLTGVTEAHREPSPNRALVHRRGQESSDSQPAVHPGTEMCYWLNPENPTRLITIRWPQTQKQSKIIVAVVYVQGVLWDRGIVYKLKINGQKVYTFIRVRGTASGRCTSLIMWHMM